MVQQTFGMFPYFCWCILLYIIEWMIKQWDVNLCFLWICINEILCRIYHDCMDGVWDHSLCCTVYSYHLVHILLMHFGLYFNYIQCALCHSNLVAVMQLLNHYVAWVLSISLLILDENQFGSLLSVISFYWRSLINSSRSSLLEPRKLS